MAGRLCIVKYLKSQHFGVIVLSCLLAVSGNLIYSQFKPRFSINTGVSDDEEDDEDYEYCEDPSMIRNDYTKDDGPAKLVLCVNQDLKMGKVLLKVMMPFYW